jgi:GTP-binding protein HflX
VVDAASDAREAQIVEVDKVLAEIGASAVPRLLVWNKIDRNGLEPGVDRGEYDRILRVRLSAKTGSGVDGLRRALIEAAASRTSPASPPNSMDVQRQAAEA